VLGYKSRLLGYRLIPVTTLWLNRVVTFEAYYPARLKSVPDFRTAR
jgi:hypothetical protein